MPLVRAMSVLVLCVLAILVYTTLNSKGVYCGNQEYPFGMSPPVWTATRYFDRLLLIDS